MPEYLAPGVYVEEIEIGPTPIEGVGTSTVGMVGVTERGRSDGLPILVTSFADFQRKFGGFLGSQFGNYRFLAYAVDAFFRNGGQRVYIKRILLKGAGKASINSSGGISASLVEDTPQVVTGPNNNEDTRKIVKLPSLRGIQKSSKLRFTALNDDGTPQGTPEDVIVDSYDPIKSAVTLKTALNNQYLEKNTKITVIDLPDSANALVPSIKFKAKNEGEWGNQIKINVIPVSRVTTILRAISSSSPKYELKSSAGFYIGGIIEFDDGENKKYRIIENVEDKTITLNSVLTANNAGLTPTDPENHKRLSICEFKLVVSFEDTTEVFNNLNTNPNTPNYYFKVVSAKSNLLEADDLYNDPATYTRTDPFDQPTGDISQGVGGNNGNLYDSSTEAESYYIGVTGDPGEKTGIKSLEDIDEVNIIAVPGITSENVQLEIISQCENLEDRFAILDIPEVDIDSAKAHRGKFDSKYAAVYYPWIKTYDNLEKVDFFIPPSGGIAGIYARSDTERGVHKAPANEIFRGATDLEIKLGKGEQGDLNPKGINCICSFPGRGIRVWGARTISSDSLWKYINIRRLFLFLEESIDQGTQWVVFEPNDEKLWARVRQTITQFLTQVWKDGALMGTTPEEAFFVKCDRSTMTQNDIDNGRLIVTIGVSPVKPAEFVIFRIAQWTGGATS